MKRTRLGKLRPSACLLLVNNFLNTLNTKKMKKVFLLSSLLLLFAIAASAQEYKKFKVGVGAGYAIPGGNGAKGGVIFSVEPSYRLTDQIALGFRWEAAAIVRGFSESVPSTIDLDVAGISSYTLNGNYYFSNNSFRPFVGAGFGMFSLAAVKYSESGSSSTEAVQAESKMGFYPRVGFDAGHFTLTLDYNIIPSSKLEGSDAEFKNSYIGIRVGGFFGGGRK
jgi:hypothetical protein